MVGDDGGDGEAKASTQGQDGGAARRRAGVGEARIFFCY